MKLYAIIDGCNAPDLLKILDEYDPPVTCLYNDPLQPEMINRAPYLVELTEPMKAWLADLETPWGLYLVSTISLIDLRKHLRRYTYAQIPTEETPVLFRYYDPRVFWEIANILDDWVLHAFLGPIEIVASFYEGAYKQEHFNERRKQFPKNIRMKSTYLTLDENQYDAYTKITEQRYINTLYSYMIKNVAPDFLEKVTQNTDRIHIEMLRHEQMVKGVEITHAADRELLLKQKVPLKVGDLAHETLGEALGLETTDEAYYHFVRQTGEWNKITGSETQKVTFLIARALNQLAKTPITESEFHQLTNYQYLSLESSNKTASTFPVPDYLRSDEPYFYKQYQRWYYVDEESYAHLINDQRLEGLKNIPEARIYEKEFHERTNGQYGDYEGLAKLPDQINVGDDDHFEITTMEQLEKSVEKLAKDLYYFCWDQGIGSDRLIRSLGYLLVKKEIFRLKDVPHEWITALSDTDESENFRVEYLVISHFNHMPI